jgi:hypothetical protein
MKDREFPKKIAGLIIASAEDCGITLDEAADRFVAELRRLAEEARAKRKRELEEA